MTNYSNQNTQESWSGTDDLDDYNMSIQGANSESWLVGENTTETGIMSKSADMSGSKYFTGYMQSNLTNYYSAIKYEIESSSNNFESFTIADSTDRDVTGEFHPSVLQFGQGIISGTLSLATITALRVIIDNSASGNIREVVNNWMDTMWYGSGRVIGGSTVDDKLFNESHTLDTVTNDDYDGCSEKFKSGLAFYTDITVDTTLGNSFGETITWAYQRNTDNNYTLKITGTADFRASNYLGSDDGGGVTLNLDSSLATSFQMLGGSFVASGTTKFKSGQDIFNVVFTNRTSIDCNGANVEGVTINTSGAVNVTSVGSFTKNTLNKPSGSVGVTGADLGHIPDNEFISDGSGYAVELTSEITADTSMAWNNIAIGYVDGSSGGDIGVTPTGDETILANVASGFKLTVNVADGATTPSIANSGSGTVEVISSGSSDNIDDDGGFMILGSQIIYYDISGIESSRFDMKGAEDDPTDTYIMSKMLNDSTSSGATIDKRGGSKIVANQQIDYNLAGEESARYNLFDINGEPTMSEIFLKELV